MLRNIGVVVTVAVVVLLAYASMQPDTFRVERSATISAPPDMIFPLISDYRNWAAWSPWDKLDPGMTKTYSGAASGVGAAYEWSGNRQVGSGRMEIIESVPNAKIAMDLHFLKPFEARNTSEFILQAEGDATIITWAMHGPYPFISKVMGIFVSMDDMVGGDFEKGLARLKAVAEGGP
jgi:uncharacterized protein YndB with AHSA1/START domain